jgi:glycosyltransferase involved in cell wall biosynthesis
MTEPIPLSVFVLAGNEELNIAKCLASVVGWADDIFVVDSNSQDNTNDIAAQFGVTVVNNTYIDHASQLAWAFSNLPLKNDWVLFLDADNVVSPKLKGLITKEIQSPRAQEVSAFYCMHKEYFRGRVVMSMKKWWARLVRKDRVKIEQTELVDYGLVIDGPVGYLKAAIVEDNAKENNIDFWIDKHQKFAARMAAEELFRRHGLLSWAVEPKLIGTSDQSRVWLKNAWMRLPLFWRPFIYWIYRYIFRGAFLQGSAGLTFTVIQALWFRIICDMKLQEYQSAIDSNQLTIEELWRKYGSRSISGDIVGVRQAPES